MNNAEINGQLFDQALLRLLPDVFFHPVWIAFTAGETTRSLELARSLPAVADQVLHGGDPLTASQVLLMCAVQQMGAGHHAAALLSAQQSLTIAERYGLSHPAWWAAWGASAICVHQAHFQQAADYLKYLYCLLSRQHEQVLASIVDMIYQVMLNQAQMESSTADHEQPWLSDVALTIALNRLTYWGAATGPLLPLPDNLAAYQPHQVDSLPPTQRTRRRSFWQTIRKALRGELHLSWVEPDKRTWIPEVDRFDTQPARLTLPNTLLLPVTADLTESPIEPVGTVQFAVRPDAPVIPAETLVANATGTEPVKQQPAPATHAIPMLTVYALGTFQLGVNEQPLSRSINGKNKSLLAYLLMHHAEPVSRDVLMDVFWPNAEPDSARNRLNVLLHNVRQALRSVSAVPIVLFEEGAYGINPECDVWIDVDEFDRHVRKGRQLEAADRLEVAVKEYELARDLYQGDFMAEEPYEDWPVLTRERLRADYLDILDRLSRIYFGREAYAACVTLCQLILSRDNCREDAHCRLMHCYCRQEQQYLALRQYQTCVTALRTELNVEPALSTTQLYQRIRRREQV